MVLRSNPEAHVGCGDSSASILTAPVGRQAEWERLLAELKARKPALVLVAGPPGSGRTTLLVAIAVAARELGYSVIGGQEAVTVDRTTRSSDLRRIVTSMLGATAEPVTKSQPSAPSFLRLIVGFLFRRASEERAILRLLEARAPTILAIDGYAPSRGMSAWFANRLLPRVLRSAAPVLVLVADNLESMTDLRESATDTIELQPVSRDAVEEHLRAAGADLRPPLSGSELAGYCDAVADDLSLLQPLEEVLSVLRPEV
jgi:nucleoside-triphosphatase THEP1